MHSERDPRVRVFLSFLSLDLGFQKMRFLGCWDPNIEDNRRQKPYFSCKEFIYRNKSMVDHVVLSNQTLMC